MIVFWFFILHWYFSLFCQTFFLHRYAAHNMFVMNKFWERFFYVFTMICQGSSYLSARAYGILHRLHHEYADTDKDPHSPQHSKSVMDMMWKTYKVYAAVYYNTEPVEEKFTKNIPSWYKFDAFAGSWPVRLFWAAFYITFYILFATHWWMYLLLPIHFFMGPVHGVIINWYAHKFGYKNFSTDNTSVNLMPVDVLMMGEGYHNNHHKHPGRSRFSSKWYEFDVTYLIIRVLNFVRVLRIKKA